MEHTLQRWQPRCAPTPGEAAKRAIKRWALRRLNQQKLVQVTVPVTGEALHCPNTFCFLGESRKKWPPSEGWAVTSSSPKESPCRRSHGEAGQQAWKHQKCKRGSRPGVCLQLLSCARSCPTLRDPITVARQAPLSMGFSRQEHWSGLPFPSPGDLPDPGIRTESPVSPTL